MLGVVSKGGGGGGPIPYGQKTFADMVAIGDSWVSGTGATPTTNRFVDQIAAAVGSSAPLNKGNAGTTISGRAGTIVGDATGANKRAGLIFALGFNDARYAVTYWGWNGIASIYASARSAVQAYLAAGYAPTDILWVAPYYINDAGLLTGDQYQTSQSRAGFERHVAMHRSIAAEFGLYFFDSYAYLRDNGFPATGGSGDNIHANNTGHTMMKTGALLATVLTSRTVPQCLVPPVFNQPFPAVGQAVAMSDNGSWTDAPSSYAYRWKADGAVISGATTNSYTPVSGDIGKVITGEIQATGTTGSSAWTVAETVTITSAPVAASAPTVKGPLLRPYFLKYAAGSSGFGQNRTNGYGEARSNDLATAQAVLPSAPGWAMECRAKLSSGISQQQGIIGRWTKAFLWVSTNGYLYATVQTSGGEQAIGGGSLSTGVLFNLNDNVEHVIAMSASASSARVYVDGNQVGSLTATISTTGGNGAGFNVGNFNSNNTPFVNGTIDEVAVWNFDKYTANYTPPSTPYVGNESGLIALYHFDNDPYGARV